MKIALLNIFFALTFICVMIIKSKLNSVTFIYNLLHNIYK